MRIGTSNNYRNLVAAFLAGFVCAGCTTTPTSPKVLGPVFIPPGSEWSNVRRDSGSFGSGVSHVAGKALGTQNWQGRPHLAFETPEGVNVRNPTTGGLAALVKDGKPLTSWDPPISWHYPMWVGETWSTPFRVTNHANNQTTEIRPTFSVEALENVNVPAGTFKAYRVRSTSLTMESLTWYSLDLGLFVKTRVERYSNHPAGPGVREQDLLTVNVKR